MIKRAGIVRSALLFGVASMGLGVPAYLPAQSAEKVQHPAADPALPSLRGTSLGSATAAPARQPGEGAGPFRRLVIRGVTLIDGSGAPPRGPVDIVIEGNRIADIKAAGTPGLSPKPDRAPRDFDQEIDATGMYALPGFVDMHVHGSTNDKAPNLSYSYKLWLAHGVTTVRGVDLAPFELSLSERARSARNEIVAPRIFAYQRLGEGAGWTSGRVNTPEKARAWVQWAAKQGIDGIKLTDSEDQTPEVMSAILDEAKKQKLGTVAHLSQIGVGRFNAEQAGDAGLGTVTHFYGHFESLLKNGPVQNWRYDYNYANEQDRFGERLDDGVDRELNEFGRVIDDGVVEARREALLQQFHLLLDGGRRREGIRARLLKQHKRRRVAIVEIRIDGVVLRAELDARDVANADDLSAGFCPDHDIFELARGFQSPKRLDIERECAIRCCRWLVDRAGRDLQVCRL